MITKNPTAYNTEFYGLSTDEKPMDCGNASVFLEMDTKKVFIFDAQNKVWLPLKEG